MIPAAAIAQSPTPTPPELQPVTAGAAILVDLSNENRVLFARSSQTPLAPASLTKVVTALVARDQYDLNEVVTASPRVLEPYGSDLGLAPGMKETVRDLLYALLLESANDVAVAIAAHHPVGYDHFIRLMNEKARALGAFDSRFHNPHGLDAIGHVSSAWDMAIFSRNLLVDPVLAAMVDTSHYKIPWKNGETLDLKNHNKLIERDPNIIGVKNGFTAQAGNCLISATRTAAGTFLAVVMRSQDHYKDSVALLARGRTLSAGTAPGGGSAGTGSRLPDPPAASTDEIVAALPTDWDPRDEEWWGFLMIGLALAAVATVGIRRRDPLVRAADVHPWLEPLLRPAERR